MPETKRPPAKRPTVPKATEGVPSETKKEGGADAAGGAPVTTGATARPPRPLPVLPTTKTKTVGILEDKTVVLYGQAGIGKSTLASEWAGGDMLFFDTAGELSELEVYRAPVSDWISFREWCASYTVEMNKPEEERPYRGCVIDTADMLGTFCSQAIRKRLGIVHESDAEWGKGWDALKGEFTSHLAKLSALPGGVILVSHAKGIEITKRNEKYDRQVPTLTGGVREACINAADLVLYIDYDEGGDNRVIYTKPSKYHEAKERSKVARLPDMIVWPFGESGYEVLRRAWYGQ